jgi:hypothetical protein
MKNMTAKVMVFLVVLTLLNAAVLQADTATAAAAAPSVLEQMPTEAVAVLATKPLAGLNSKVDVFAHQIGAVPPETPVDIVAMINAQLSATLGGPVSVDGAKGLGVAVMNLMAPQQSFAIYMPVVDVEKLIALLASKESAGTNIWKFREDMYVGISGSYLLFGPNLVALTQATTGAKGVKLTAAEAQLFSQSDVAVTARLVSVMPMLKGMATAGMAGNVELQKYPNWVALLTKAMDRVCELESAGLGLNLGQQGINVKFNCQAVVDSVLAKYMSGHNKGDLSRLAKLPANDYIYAVSANLDAKILLDPINAVLDALVADPRFAGKINAGDMDRAKSLLKEIYTMTHGFAEALYLPSEGVPAAGGLNMIMVATSAETAKSLAKVAELMPLITKIAEQMGYKLVLSYNKGAGKVGELNYDEVVVDFSGLPLPPQMMQALTNAYGTPACKEQICRMSDEVVAVGIGQGCIDKAVAMVKTGPAGLDKQPDIAGTAANLPTKANAYIFVDVSKCLQWYCQMLQSQMQSMVQQGQQDPQCQQQAQQQIAMMVNIVSMVAGQMKGSVGESVILEDGGLKADAFVPTELVKSGVQSVQQVIGMMMMGAMQGGGAPGGDTQPQPPSEPQSEPQP